MPYMIPFWFLTPYVRETFTKRVPFDNVSALVSSPLIR